MTSNWRSQTAVWIILLMGVLAVFTLASYCEQLRRSPRDAGAIDMNEARFATLRQILPERGTVGYLSDTGGKEKNPKAYYLTQYFLAPVVIAPDTMHEFVVANFASPSSIPQMAAAQGLRVEHDFFNGVALLRRR